MPKACFFFVIRFAQIMFHRIQFHHIFHIRFFIHFFLFSFQSMKSSAYRYGGITWASWRLRLPTSQLFVSAAFFERITTNKSQKLRDTSPFREDSTNHWIHIGPVMRKAPPYHYNDVIMGVMASQAQIKENITRHWPLCVGNPPETGEFPAQMASNAENVSIWWRHHDREKSPDCSSLQSFFSLHPYKTIRSVFSSLNMVIN